MPRASEIVLLARAERHFHREFARLAENNAEAAEHFDAVVNEGLRQLLNQPFSAPVFERPVRRLVIGAYALGVYYVFEGNRIVVHGLLDTRRDPEWIRRELDLD